MAGKITELNVLETLSEPVAAVLAFGHKNTSVNEENILVYDLGILLY